MDTKVTILLGVCACLLTTLALKHVIDGNIVVGALGTIVGHVSGVLVPSPFKKKEDTNAS